MWSVWIKEYPNLKKRGFENRLNACEYIKDMKKVYGDNITACVSKTDCDNFLFRKYCRDDIYACAWETEDPVDFKEDSKKEFFMDKQEQKIKASAYLAKLKVSKKHRDEFSKNGECCLFRGYVGSALSQYPELMKKKRRIEEQYNTIVYAVIENIADGDLIYDFLFVDSDSEQPYLQKISNLFYPFGYAWNVLCPKCSKLGQIAVSSAHGGLKEFSY